MIKTLSVYFPLGMLASESKIYLAHALETVKLMLVLKRFQQLIYYYAVPNGLCSSSLTIGANMFRPWSKYCWTLTYTNISTMVNHYCIN